MINPRISKNTFLNGIPEMKIHVHMHKYFMTYLTTVTYTSTNRNLDNLVIKGHIIKLYTRHDYVPTPLPSFGALVTCKYALELGRK